MLTLPRIVERAAELHASRRAVYDEYGAELTYKELISRALSLASGLIGLGIRPGDRVGILARNSFRYLEVNLACACAGIVLLPLNIRLAPAEIDSILDLTETSLLLKGLPYQGNGRRVVEWDDRELPGHDNSYEALIRRHRPLDQTLPCQPRDIAQIFFTSGTTGQPKGVCLTHENLVASALDSIIALELHRGDVWFHAPPMFHLVDAFAIWAMTLLGGQHVTAHFDPASFGMLVQERRITKTSLPPVLLDMIVRDPSIARLDLSSLKCISYGGAAMADATFARVSRVFRCPLIQAYGITETSGIVCHQSVCDISEEWEVRTNSVGQPVAHIELRILDDEGHPLPPGRIGEIVVRGPRVMHEYWRNPAATRTAIPDGWYRTGDLGIMDAEGYCAITGRKKDMIITGAENVYPAEVENVLCSHPAVLEAAVIGVPSERWGEEVHAIVVIDKQQPASPEQLLAHCRKFLGGYKVPKRIALSDNPLPKSGPGKIAKHLLRAYRDPMTS